MCLGCLEGSGVAGSHRRTNLLSIVTLNLITINIVTEKHNLTLAFKIKVPDL